MMRKLPPEIRLIRVQAKGIPTIADGRIFFFRPWVIDDRLTPPMTLPGLTFNEEPCVEHIASNDMPSHCPTCGEPLDYQVVSHSWEWMTGCFYCPKHRLEVWIDYYPKNNVGTTQDRLNAWVLKVDGENIAMKEVSAVRNAFIANEAEIQSDLSKRKERAPLLLTFTPDGFKEIPLTVPRLIVTSWWKQLTNRVMSRQASN